MSTHNHLGSDPRTTLPDVVDVVVVGAGIAGLAAGLTAADSGATVLVLDGHPGGGRARTVSQAGFVHNTGPHALYLAGHLHDLLLRRGHDLPGGTPDTAVLHLWRGGQEHALKVGATGILRSPLFSARGRIRLLAFYARLAQRDPAALVGRTVDEWLADEPDDMAAFLRTMVRLAAYAHASDELDAGAALGQLQIGGRGVRYVDGGWSSVIDALASALVTAGGSVRTDTEVLAVRTDPSGADVGTTLVVDTAAGPIRASSVVVAVGGPDTAERLTGTPVRGRSNLSSPVAAATLDLGLRTPYVGFHLGVDRPLYLSPHAPAGRLAPEGAGLVGIARYLAPGEPAGDPAERRAELRSFARSAGIVDDLVVHERYLHHVVVAHGVPTARGGGLAGRPTIDAVGIPGVFVAGDWVGPVGFIADAAAASGEDAGGAAARHALRGSIAA